MKHLAFLAFAIALTGCQQAQPVAPAQAPAPLAPADPALAFAQGACGDCHAVEPNWLSPNREAPTFPAIANREGLTGKTLTTWLRDAHNYPEAMDFDLTDDRVRELSDYILTLRSDDFRPAP